MNLTKWFNWNYLVQNIKKSKGILTVLILIVPILTTLVFISVNSSADNSIIHEEVLNAVNILGMYTIPFIVSVILGGYIYKKSSVDFINSMPMNRKTIYFTNFIGGIIIILIIQTLLLGTNLIATQIFDGIFIAKGMIYDSFALMLVAYIFVFSVCMLAQTISGNVLTQIVLVLLIMFLVPFSHSVFTNNNTNEATVWVLQRNNTISPTLQIEERIIPNYTLPYKIISEVFFSSSALYNEVSIARMIVLSVVYTWVGAILFEKRKMENVGSSFESMKAHFIVKGLTLVPIVFFCCMLEVQTVYVGIAITLMAVYYLLYDFIVNKKVKIQYTVLCFAVSVIGLFGAYYGILHVVDSTRDKTLSVDDIVGIGIEDLYLQAYTDVEHDKTLDFMIRDKDLIKEICDNFYDENRYFIYGEALYTEEFSYKLVNVKFELKGGKEIYSYMYIEDPVYDKMIGEIKRTLGYENLFNYGETKMTVDYRFLPDDLASRIKDILEKRNYNMNGLHELYTQPITLYTYENHSLRTINISIGVTKEIFDMISKYSNEYAAEQLKHSPTHIETYCYINKFKLNGERVFVSDDMSTHLSPRLLNYITSHSQTPCNINREFVVINVHSGNRLHIYLNMTDDLNQILKDTGRNWRSEVDPDYFGVDEKTVDYAY